VKRDSFFINYAYKILKAMVSPPLSPVPHRSGAHAYITVFCIADFISRLIAGTTSCAGRYAVKKIRLKRAAY
jgi:hypothetical protein